MRSRAPVRGATALQAKLARLAEENGTLRAQIERLRLADARERSRELGKDEASGYVTPRTTPSTLTPSTTYGRLTPRTPSTGQFKRRSVSQELGSPTTPRWRSHASVERIDRTRSP